MLNEVINALRNRWHIGPVYTYLERMKCIYLDHNATTPVDPRVKQALLPYLENDFGNPSSQSHPYGWKAQMGVEKARAQAGKLLGVPAKNVLWTAGATESNNLAILGLLDFYLEKGERPHFITDAVEHKAVLQVVERAKNIGAELSIAPVNKEGVVEISELQKLIRPNTRLISVMAANNEIGSINDIDGIGELCESHEIVFHCDAAQAVGRIPLSPRRLKDSPRFAVFSSRGMRTMRRRGSASSDRPINRSFELRPIMAGGEQERGLRPGTLNVPGIVGIGAAGDFAG